MEEQSQQTQEQAETEALRKELAAAEVELAEAQERREARKTPAQLREEIERAKRKARDIDALAQLEAEHGLVDKDIKPLETLQGMVVVRRPKEMAYRKFADLEKMTTAAAKELALSCLLCPTKEIFNEWAQVEPAIIGRAAAACVWLAGNRKELEEKK
jgi:hypothetical protein